MDLWNLYQLFAWHTDMNGNQINLKTGDLYRNMKSMQFESEHLTPSPSIDLKGGRKKLWLPQWQRTAAVVRLTSATLGSNGGKISQNKVHHFWLFKFNWIELEFKIILSVIAPAVNSRIVTQGPLPNFSWSFQPNHKSMRWLVLHLLRKTMAWNCISWSTQYHAMQFRAVEKGLTWLNLS